MRTWLRAVVTTPTAFDDLKAYLREHIDAEDRLTKATTTEQLYEQRGKVAAFNTILFHVQNAAQEKRS